MPRSEAIRFYWEDALNEFRNIRSMQTLLNDSDQQMAYTRYYALVLPEGASVWTDDTYNPVINSRHGREELRNGKPQMELLVDFKVATEDSAKQLFQELGQVIRELPGAVLRGEQYPLYTTVWTVGRKDRRTVIWQMDDEPEDGNYVIGLSVWFNMDDVTDE